MAEITTSRIAELSRDAAYVTIGLGVIAFQQAQVRRRAMLDQLQAQAGKLKEQVDNLKETAEGPAQSLQDAFDALEERVDTLVSTVQDLIQSLGGIDLKTPDLSFRDLNLVEVRDTVSDRMADVAKASKAAAEEAYAQVVSIVRRSQEEGADTVHDAESQVENLASDAKDKPGEATSAA